MLRERDQGIATHLTDDAGGALGVNDRADLMQAEAVAQTRILERLAHDGVTFLQPATTRVEAGVAIGEDTVVGPGREPAGLDQRRARAPRSGPHTTVIDSRIGERRAASSTPISWRRRWASARPSARSPTSARAPCSARDAKVGTFVEVKNSDVGEGAKIPHLSYVGDADVGAGSNLGASTITANYDGRKKHRTTIGEGVKTGIHTSLVAPVDVGDRAYTGAGSVITGDVPEGALGIGRSKQKNVDGYADRVEDKDEPK